MRNLRILSDEGQSPRDDNCLKIELIDPQIERTVDRILSGELPPVTGDKEVIQEIARRVSEGEIRVRLFRREGDGEIVVYPPHLVATLENRWPEPRPIGGT
jgi:hypothetical protein